MRAMRKKQTYSCYSCQFITYWNKKSRVVQMHCKNEAREIDCLCCREVNVMFFFRLKSWSAREASRHVDFMGNCLTVSHTFLLYLPRIWVLSFSF